MVVECHDGYTVEATGLRDSGTVRITSADGAIRLRVDEHHVGNAEVDLTPEQARDVALYLLREQRLVEKGSG